MWSVVFQTIPIECTNDHVAVFNQIKSLSYIKLTHSSLKKSHSLHPPFSFFFLLFMNANWIHRQTYHSLEKGKTFHYRAPSGKFSICFTKKVFRSLTENQVCPPESDPKCSRLCVCCLLSQKFIVCFMVILQTHTQTRRKKFPTRQITVNYMDHMGYWIHTMCV